MFTGIIENLGRVVSLKKRGAPLISLEIECKEFAPLLILGDSISVEGVCLTVVSLSPSSFTVDIVEETLKKTNLSHLKEGDFVNLERALLFQGRINGHFVQGHVDGVGSLLFMQEKEGAFNLKVGLSPELAFPLIEKGSIALNGVSLTIWDVQPDSFFVTLIPFTKEHTTLGNLSVGALINIEIDMLAKMVAQFQKREKLVCTQ